MATGANGSRDLRRLGPGGFGVALELDPGAEPSAWIDRLGADPQPLLDAFHDAHGLLVVKGAGAIAAAPELLVRLSRLFGPEVEDYRRTLTPARLIHDRVPEILVVSNLAPMNFEVPRPPDPPRTAEGALPVRFPHRKGWHTDQSFRRPPPDVSLFYAAAPCPRGQGQTLYADGTAAYAALEPELKERVADLEAVHAIPWTGRGEDAVRAGETPRPLLEHQSSQRQPVVRRHPVTGVPALYLCGESQLDWVLGPFAGLPPGPDGEAARLLHALLAHYTQPRFTYIHEWDAGDLVIHDNRNTMHAATWFDGAPARARHVAHDGVRQPGRGLCRRAPELAARARRSDGRPRARHARGAQAARAAAVGGGRGRRRHGGPRMSLADETAYLSATELAGRIARRELSPVEVVDAAIARIEARNPSLNAFVIDGYEDARARAREDERALMSGRELGPLHGVPSAIKDLFGFKPGWRNTFGGIRALKDHVADSYCAFVERLERGGANFVGKTNSPIEGFRGTCDNYLFGPTSTPFRLGRNSGGSSGGSAAAVADGLVPIAHGTDGGGSIRIPAAWCGVYGYKPSWGRSPFIIRPNAFAGDAPFLFEGPLTRTVEDAALAMSVLAGHDPADPYSIDGAVDWRGATRRSIRGWKIAYSADFDVYPVDPRIAATVDAAVRRFEQAGATVVEVKLGIERPQRELSDLWCRLISPLNAMGLEDFKRGGIDLERDHHDDLPPEYWRWIEVGRRMSALDFFRDQEIRSEIYDAVQAVMADHDLLVTPTLACMPVANGADGQHQGPDRDQRRSRRPADRLVHDLLRQLHGQPGGVGPGRPRRRPPGRHADHRPPSRRRRRHRRQRRLRTAPALARELRPLRPAQPRDAAAP